MIKNVLWAILALTALAWYFDFSPTELLPTVQNTGGAVSEGPTRAAPPKPSSTPAVSPGGEGSMAVRWGSPGKP